MTAPDVRGAHDVYIGQLTDTDLRSPLGPDDDIDPCWPRNLFAGAATITFLVEGNDVVL